MWGWLRHIFSIMRRRNKKQMRKNLPSKEFKMNRIFNWIGFFLVWNAVLLCQRPCRNLPMELTIKNDERSPKKIKDFSETSIRFPRGQSIPTKKQFSTYSPILHFFPNKWAYCTVLIQLDAFSICSRMRSLSS